MSTERATALVLDRDANVCRTLAGSIPAAGLNVTTSACARGHPEVQA
jgi:hypothetical protein